MIYRLLYLLLILIPLKSFGQSAYYDIRKGNSEYNNNIYIAAENRYRESLSKESDLLESNYNLGNTLYRQGKYEEASKYYQNAAAKAEDKEAKSKAFHNLGNSFLKEQKFEESVEAYKGALVNNPNDEDSRYNLAYAKQMLQQQQEQEQQQQQDQDQQQEENKDQEQKENQEEQKQEQEQEQEQQQEQEENEEQEPQPQEPKEEEMSREDAERILEALNNKEKEVQERLKKKKGKEIDVNIEKDW